MKHPLPIDKQETLSAKSQSIGHPLLNFSLVSSNT